MSEPVDHNKNESIAPRHPFIEKAVLVLVLLSLGTLAYGGHRVGWKVSKFSALWGQTAEKEDWCDLHHVPESVCIECDPKLVPKSKEFGWCAKHGVAECPLCHPETASVPVKDLEKITQRSELGLKSQERSANNPICKSHQRRIQFASLEEIEKAGISVEAAWTAPMIEFLSAPAEIIFDQTKVAHLAVRSSGTVWRVMRHLGGKVKAGEMLALVDSMEVGKAKSDLLQMVALSQLRTLTLGRLRAAGQATPFATLEEAESSLRESTIKLNAARQTLVNLGLPMDNINMQGITTEMLESKLHFLGIPAEISGKLDPLQTTRNLLPLVSPIDGIIVSREVVAGEVVDASKILFEVVDNEHKWMTLDVKSEDARFLHLGQKVLFQENQSIKDIVCNLSWVSTQADLKTRTVKARANLNDEGGKMRANTFGTGKIILREEPQALCVPKEAVHWEGCCNIVFVRDANFLNPDAPKFFSVRKVRIGIRDDNQVEILAGLLPGELVVKQGSGLLLSELLKGSLGEGCACHSKK